MSNSTTIQQLLGGGMLQIPNKRDLYNVARLGDYPNQEPDISPRRTCPPPPPVQDAPLAAWHLMDPLQLAAPSLPLLFHLTLHDPMAKLM